MMYLFIAATVVFVVWLVMRSNSKHLYSRGYIAMLDIVGNQHASQVSAQEIYQITSARRSKTPFDKGMMDAYFDVVTEDDN